MARRSDKIELKTDHKRSYFVRFEIYVDINYVPAEKKLKSFCNVLGAKRYEEWTKILVTALPTQNIFYEIRELLDNLFSLVHAISPEQSKFN